MCVVPSARNVYFWLVTFADFADPRFTDVVLMAFLFMLAFHAITMWKDPCWRYWQKLLVSLSHFPLWGPVSAEHSISNSAICQTDKWFWIKFWWSSSVQSSWRIHPVHKFNVCMYIAAPLNTINSCKTIASWQCLYVQYYWLFKLHGFVYVSLSTVTLVLCPKEREKTLKQNGAAMKKTSDVSECFSLFSHVCMFEDIPILG